ncbi:T-cell surface glycoprotein CD3 gamma chain-like isoform X1 [Arapaima gigas]
MRTFYLTLLLMFARMVLPETLIIQVQELAKDQIKLICKGKNWIDPNGLELSNNTLTLQYADEHSGEYKCANSSNEDGEKIFVKFRTCDNCIKLETSTLMGIVSGDVLVTILIGMAVYFIASQPSPRSYSNSKASDRQTLLAHQGNQANDLYTPLTHGNSEQYSELQRKPHRK